MSIFSRHKKRAAAEKTRTSSNHEGRAQELYGRLLASTTLADGGELRAYTKGFVFSHTQGEESGLEWIEVACAHTHNETMSLTVETIDSRTLTFTLAEDSIAYVFRERIQDTFLGSVEREVISPCDPGVQSALRGQLRRGADKAYVDVYLDSIYIPFEENLPIFVRDAMESARRELSDEYALPCTFRPAPREHA